MSAVLTEAAATTRTFEWLVATYHGDVFRFLHRLCNGQRQDAEDLTQEVFLRAYRAFGTLDSEANHRAWVYRIAYNAFLNTRRARREFAVVEDDHPDRPVDHEGRELVQAIGAYVATLPSKQRAALILRRVEDREYADIARILGCREEAARASVFQAVKKIRDRFGEEYRTL